VIAAILEKPAAFRLVRWLIKNKKEAQEAACAGKKLW
jgi:hypothetical protein